MTLHKYQHLKIEWHRHTYVLRSAKKKQIEAFLERDVRICQITAMGKSINARSVTMFVLSR